jgi:hypothetical protein
LWQLNRFSAEKLRKSYEIPAFQHTHLNRCWREWKSNCQRLRAAHQPWGAGRGDPGREEGHHRVLQAPAGSQEGARAGSGRHPGVRPGLRLLRGAEAGLGGHDLPHDQPQGGAGPEVLARPAAVVQGFRRRVLGRDGEGGGVPAPVHGGGPGRGAGAPDGGVPGTAAEHEGDLLPAMQAGRRRARPVAAHGRHRPQAAAPRQRRAGPADQEGRRPVARR